MKLMGEEHNINNNGSSNNNGGTGTGSVNWLGFSLSPHVKMEVIPSSSSSSPPEARNHHHHQTACMFLSPQQLTNNPSVCFDGGENGGFLSPHHHHPLSVMPLKSDGSLCIMEALTRSQPPPQAPKLENFLGGETMALSLDSLYYHQNRQNHHQHHHHHHDHQQQHFDAYFSLLGSQGIYQQISDQDQGLLRNWDHEQHNISSAGLIHQINMDSNGNGNGNGNGITGVGYGDHLIQSLSLTMSPRSQSSCVTATKTVAAQAEGGGGLVAVAVADIASKKRGIGKVCQKQSVHRKSIDTFGQRTSQYRGVTKHRWTGRYEAHLWDNSCKKEGQTRKGRQVYLGGYDMEEKAARAYDLAALKYWGISTHTNFPIENYKEEIEEMKNMTRQEYVAHLRRKSSGFSRGASMYRGVTRHHQHGRWQARIGRVAGNKDLYLGTFSTQEEAAEAYDVAAIKFRGANAVTNFDISRYDVEKIMASNTLLAGEHAKRNKVEAIEGANDRTTSADDNVGESISTLANNGNASEWKMMAYHSHNHYHQQQQQQQQSYENPSFSLALQDLVGLETGSPAQPMGEDPAKLGSAQFSSPSSLVTSLNSSREGSPERNRNGNGNGNGSKIVGPASVVNIWLPPAQLRPASAAAAATAIPMVHIPVFAAWGET